jgi:Family of unknown function (DUF6519)
MTLKLSTKTRKSGWITESNATIGRNKGLKREYSPKCRLGPIPRITPTSPPAWPTPWGGYQGLENQLYRVEIHQRGEKVTFKWSRDNGSVVAAWEGMDDNDLIVGGVHDRVHGFAPGQWVELTNEIDQVKKIPGVMVRLLKVERERLTIDSNTMPPDFELPPAWYNPIVRRWDHRESKDYEMHEGAIVLEDNKNYTLERVRA